MRVLRVSLEGGEGRPVDGGDGTVWVLETVFRKPAAEAMTIMLHVHNAGVGVAGIYTRDVAESKITTTERLAEQHEFPLRVTMEPEPEEPRR